MSTVSQNACTNETETRLLDCALTLFAVQGYDGTSVREIIEAAGVTRPVLYYYCNNKEHLFQRVVHWTHGDANLELEQHLATTNGVAEQLRMVLRGTFAFCAQDPRVPQLMFQTTYGPASELATFMESIARQRFSMIVRIMEAGLAEGELHGGDAASLAMLFCSIMDHHANTLSRTAAGVSQLTPERADALVDAFLYGVSKGRRKTPTLPPL